MYEELFHSTVRPFRATPDAKFYYPFESIENARQTITRAALRAEGPVMVLGGAGLGKSLLSLVVADDLSARFDTVKLQSARLNSRRALLQNILFELHMPYRDMSEGELRLSILDRMEPSTEHAPDGMLILVDEAHTLSSKLLEELRLITNFTRDNQPRARLVLIGNLRLEETFTEPLMESFNQRLAARCYLQPMNRQQTCDFVSHQLKIANVSPNEIITPDAINTVYAASEGVPRLSNQIMDHALVLGISRSQCPISSALIEEAWADLQQLPAPWHAGATAFESPSVARGETIEFGELNDEDEEATGDHVPPVNLFHDIDEAAETIQPAQIDETAKWESEAFSTVDSSSHDYATDDKSEDDKSEDCADVGETTTFFETDPLPVTEPQFSELPETELSQPEASAAEYPEAELQDSAGTTRAQPLVGPQNCLPECDTACDRNCTTVCERAVAAEKAALSENQTLDGGEAVRETADEDVEFETKKSNFFAAFSPAEDAALSVVSETEETVETVESAPPAEAELVRPTVVFDASLAFTTTGPNDAEASNRLKSDSFFADRPTDEQLLAFEDEQAQYDSMGIWENDPPLEDRGGLAAAEATADASDGELRAGEACVEDTVEANDAADSASIEAEKPPVRRVSSAELFGEDFDDEIPIGISSSEPVLSSRFSTDTDLIDVESTDLDSKRREGQAAEAADYVARIQEFADAVGTSEEETVTVNDVLLPEENSSLDTLQQSEGQSPEILELAVEGWSVDVATLDASNELAVHNEIEDLVSQLNFAAFSVEPYSVEQIAIEPQNARPQVPDDSVRTGENDEIYTLHRGQSSAATPDDMFSEMALSYDDDRDLLIVEEDLPPRTAGNAPEASAEKPATKIAPYSQLFAKLRK